MVEYDYVSKGKLVAIVDDQDDIVEFFPDALGSINNTTVFTFTDPVMTLEHFIINKENYVLVISDLRMPALSKRII